MSQNTDAGEDFSHDEFSGDPYWAEPFRVLHKRVSFELPESRITVVRNVGEKFNQVKLGGL